MANSESTLQGRDKDAYEYDSAIGWQRKSKVTNTPSEPIPTSIVDSDGNEAKVSEDHLKIEIKQSENVDIPIRPFRQFMLNGVSSDMRVSGTLASPIDFSISATNVEGGSEDYIMTLDFSDQFGMPWGIRLPKDSNLKLIARIKDDTSGVDAFNAIAYGFDRVF